MRYTMPARSQGKLYAQRASARLAEKDVHNCTPEVECTVREWLFQRLVGFYCDLQLMYTPPLPSLARGAARDLSGVDDTERGTV